MATCVVVLVMVGGYFKSASKIIKKVVPITVVGSTRTNFHNNNHIAATQ
jgi:hypothetical protein